MATTTSKAKPSSAGGSTAAFQARLARIVKFLDEDFPDLASVNPRMKYLVAGMWQIESANNPYPRITDVVFQNNSLTEISKPSSGVKRIWTGSQVVKRMRDKFGDDLVRQFGVTRMHGIGQVSGYYHIDGITDGTLLNAKDSAKKALEDKYGLRYDPMCGNSIYNEIYVKPFGGFLGEERGMAASLGVLRTKLRATRDLGKAIKAYLGNGVDKFGSTPDVYLAKIENVAANIESGGSQMAMGSAVPTEIVASSEARAATAACA